MYVQMLQKCNIMKTALFSSIIESVIESVIEICNYLKALGAI